MEISLETRTKLLILNRESMSPRLHHDLIIHAIIISFAQEFGLDFVFTNTNLLASKFREECNALREEWQAMDQEFIRSLILSILRRVETVRRARTHT